ncbi:DUF6941 family protein [Actinomycetospora corticicola]|uniref:Uncharacterized protein n=1 Tax=Actinomycetospora corticicola TaxID=663602 RepID=A0A7Y9E008_9PSEU|nr:hypothetical protein [Actinomycetospora corticicola]NYD38561.1 hypothetical protein [Actinomycetospora corticicola]
MIADFAQVHGGKLFVSGGAINLLAPLRPEAPFAVNFAVALSITIPWQATNQMHRLAVSISDTDGELVPMGDELPPGAAAEDRGKFLAEFNMGRSPIMVPGEESVLPVAIPLLGLPLPHPGSYQVIAELDGSEEARRTVRLLDPNSQGRWGQGF